MPIFHVSERQIVLVSATFEAENAEEAEQMFLDGDPPNIETRVLDSDSLTVEIADESITPKMRAILGFYQNRVLGFWPPPQNASDDDMAAMIAAGLLIPTGSGQFTLTDLGWKTNPVNIGPA